MTVDIRAKRDKKHDHHSSKGPQNNHNPGFANPKPKKTYPTKTFTPHYNDDIHVSSKKGKGRYDD